MPIENALVASAKSHIFQAKLRAGIQNEIQKGCRPDISSKPVPLEPAFEPLWQSTESQDSQNLLQVTEPTDISRQYIRLRAWISPEQNFNWNSAELFLKQLQLVKQSACFEIFGNGKTITFAFLINPFDLAVVVSAFQGEFELCEITPLNYHPFVDISAHDGMRLQFRDFYPSPPYSHLFTRSIELKTSPLKSLIIALSKIEPPAVGLYQVLFKPVASEHNWHRNVQILLDFEYNLKLMSGFQQLQRYSQQSPSGDLHQMAQEVESKAHNDKPFFTAALRTAVAGAPDHDRDYLDGISTFTGLLQHGGRPLKFVSNDEYSRVLTPSQMRDMFVRGWCHRPGFLLNSLELTSLVHLPPVGIFESRQVPLDPLELLTVRSPELKSGTWIGSCKYAGETIRVHIPDDQRRNHLHLLGRTGRGKSTTLEHIIMHDIQQNNGVAVLDPHGDLVERILRLISKEHVDRTIYLNPGDPDWVPLWNPLEKIPGQDTGRTANNIVKAIESFVASGGWGDRIDNILRNLVYALINLPGSTFLDIGCLLRNKSKQNDLIIREIKSVLDNETARHFWNHDYHRYGATELSPPINKIGKLLLSDTVSLMFSQPENRLKLRAIMDEGKILLIDLSALDSNVKQVLGCFILSLLHLNAISRSDISVDRRKQFYIHCDEAHQFLTETLENLIAETRKFGVGLTLVHQYLSQFGKKKTDAISTVGSAIIFSVDNRDANYLAKDLQGKVASEELVALKKYEAVARIDTEVVKFMSRKPQPVPKINHRDQIVEQSRRRYCSHASEIRDWVRRRNDRWCKPFSPLTSWGGPDNTCSINDELTYDEFD